MKKFILYESSTGQQTKMHRGETFPILNPQLKAELNELAEVELKPRMDNSISDDEGTCVLGAGIVIQVFKSVRHKYPFDFMLLKAPFQGNVSNYKSLKPVIEFLKKQYPHLKATYYDGRMD